MSHLADTNKCHLFPFFFFFPLFLFLNLSNKDPALYKLFEGTLSVDMAQTSTNQNLHRPFRKALELKQTGAGPGPADFNMSVSGGFVFTVAVPPCLLCPPRRPALCSVQLFWELQNQTDVNISWPHCLELLQQTAKTRASTNSGLTWQRTLKHCCFIGRASATQHFHLLLGLSPKSL